MFDQNIILEYKKIKWFSEDFNKEILHDDLGEHSLVEIKPELKKIKRLFDDIFEHKNLESLDDNSNSIIIEQFNALYEIFEQLKQYTDYRNRNNSIDLIKKFTSNTDRKLIPIIQILNFHIEKKEDNKKLERIIKKAEENLRKSDKILSEHQTKNIPEITDRFSNIFEKESDLNGGNACKLLVGLSILIIISIISVFLINCFYPEMHILNKAFIYSLFLLLISTFRKGYLSQKHQESLNRHRQNVLNSLGQFISSIQNDDKNTANFVLKELIKSIAENKDTGYIKSSGSNFSPSTKIDMVKSFSD